MSNTPYFDEYESTRKQVNEYLATVNTFTIKVKEKVENDTANLINDYKYRLKKDYVDGKLVDVTLEMNTNDNSWVSLPSHIGSSRR